MKNYDRVWATVDLDAVKYNMVQMKNNIREDSKIMAVVKTDGYGHGAVPIAHEIEDMPFLHGFAVATVEEALILKEAEYASRCWCSAILFLIATRRWPGKKSGPQYSGRICWKKWERQARHAAGLLKYI